MALLEKARTTFKGWPRPGQRAAVAVAFYLIWLFSVWIYSEGLHGAAELMGIISSVGFFFAIGGRYILRGALFVLLWWLRLFR